MCSASISKTLQTACLCSSSVFVKDQDVVQVHYDNPFHYDGSEDVVHHSLESSGAVGHSKEHYEGFKEAAIGVEGCLLFISRLDTHIVEPPPDVKFCEVLGSAELGDEFGDKGERIPVTNFIWPYLHQFSIDSHGLNGYGKPLKRPFDRYQSRLEAISNGRDIRQINW